MSSPEVQTLLELQKQFNRYYLLIVMHWPTRRNHQFTVKEILEHEDRDKSEWVFKGGFER